MVDTDKHAVLSRYQNAPQGEWRAGFAFALAAIAGSLLFSASAKAQAADPTYSFDDPRLMRQVIKDPASGVVSTNYYVPKELGVDGSPVLHTVSTLALELDANGRKGFSEVFDSGIITATGLRVQTTNAVAIVAASKEYYVKRVLSPDPLDETPAGLSGFRYMVANNSYTNAPPNTRSTG